MREIQAIFGDAPEAIILDYMFDSEKDWHTVYDISAGSKMKAGRIVWTMKKLEGMGMTESKVGDLKEKLYGINWKSQTTKNFYGIKVMLRDKGYSQS